MGEAFIRNRVRSRLPSFTYTGDYELIDEGHGNWRVKFLSSGDLTFKTTGGKVSHGIDVFLVGGGGDPAYQYYGNVATAQGGGGYTLTQKSVSVEKNVTYPIVVGQRRQASSAFGYTANQGQNGWTEIIDLTPYGGGTFARSHGGNGGSGGAAAQDAFTGLGGVDGANGGGSEYAGNGQGRTTREFGESGGDLYSTGGGTNSTNTPNSGNGGYWGTNANGSGGFNGCSGIVIIRNHRE